MQNTVFDRSALIFPLARFLVFNESCAGFDGKLWYVGEGGC